MSVKQFDSRVPPYVCNFSDKAMLHIWTVSINLDLVSDNKLLYYGAATVFK